MDSIVPLNGFQDQQQTPLQAAQARVVAAIMGQGMNPASAGISGYANSVLQSARLSAVCQLLIEAGILPKNANATWTPEDALDALITRKLTETAEALEAQAARPKLVMPGH